MISTSQTRPEFSRPLIVDAIGPEEQVKTIEADERERAALARRFGLLSLERLEAELRMRRLEALEIIAIEVRLEARATQACVVTLEPVTCRVAESVEWRYSLASHGATVESESQQAAKDVWIEVEGADPPEPIGPEGIDLGEAVAQQFAIAIDPFPRAKGASLAQLEVRDAGRSDEIEGPFAVLKSLRGKG